MLDFHVGLLAHIGQNVQKFSRKDLVPDEVGGHYSFLLIMEKPSTPEGRLGFRY